MNEDSHDENAASTKATGGNPLPANVEKLLFQPIRSALFVDFDNIFSSLHNEVDEAMALSFANNPTRWLGWLEQQVPKYAPYDQLIISDGGIQGTVHGRAIRRLLWRRVYMNPDRYRHFRGNLVAAGIEVIDCPVLTGFGKTAADMIMAIGILDALKQEPPVEEFIILAADADYTPVVQRLRQNDRRSIVLPIGGVSPAYKNAADQVFDPNKFMDFLLPVVHSSHPPVAEQHESRDVADLGREREVQGGSIAGGDYDGEFRLEQIRLFLQELLANNRGRVDLPVIGQKILEKFGRYPDGGTLKSMLAKFTGEALQIAQDDQGRSYAYHPATYLSDDANGQEGNFALEDLFLDKPELATLVRRITSGTGAPDLSGEEYKVIFRSIADEINANGYNFIQTSKEGRNRCHTAGHRIARADVAYVLRCLYNHRHDLYAPQQEQVVARGFKAGLLAYCKRNQIDLTDDDLLLFHEWIQVEDTSGDNVLD